MRDVHEKLGRNGPREAAGCPAAEERTGTRMNGDSGIARRLISFPKSVPNKESGGRRWRQMESSRASGQRGARGKENQLRTTKVGRTGPPAGLQGRETRSLEATVGTADQVTRKLSDVQSSGCWSRKVPEIRKNVAATVNGDGSTERAANGQEKQNSSLGSRPPAPHRTGCWTGSGHPETQGGSELKPSFRAGEAGPGRTSRAR